ncbi:MAG: hypothetical protein V2A58_07260 [Planctomycetota bacterium]
MTPWIVDFPKECEVVQRRPDNRADIEVRVFDPERRSYEARIEGIASVSLDRSSSGVLSGVLRDVPAGDHRLFVQGPDVTKVIDRVGVGDVHGAIGQSHTAGRSWTLFRSKDGRTADPTNMNDAPFNRVRDSAKLGGEHDPEGQALGSWFPILADYLTGHWAAPQKFLNYAVGGSLTAIWHPGANPYRRALSAFENAGVRYVICNIGASDAVGGASVAELKERIAATVRDLLSRGFRVLLGRMPFGMRDEWNASMRRQQQAAADLWDEIPGLYRGADLAKLDPQRHINRVDGVHLNAAGYLEAARLWLEAYRALPRPPAGAA